MPLSGSFGRHFIKNTESPPRFPPIYHKSPDFTIVNPMKPINKNTTQLAVLPSSCDHTGKLGRFDVFKTFMDLANEHATVLGINQAVLVSRNQFWLTVKTRVHFYNRPDMGKMMTAETWPMKPGSLRTDRCYRLTCEDQLVAEGKTEWAVMDFNTGRLANIATVFPTDFEFCQDTVDLEDFPRIVLSEQTDEVRGPYRVSSSDTDMGMHMNNTAYVRALLGLFTTKELDEMDIQDICVIFKASAHEGDMLRMPIVRSGNIIDTGLVFEDGKPAVVARITCKN